MLNHTYTSVKNANLVDCGKKQHLASQPSILLKENFLGEFRTELDKKKVLANLGIITDISLEWEYIKGDIGKSVALMQELDSRTKYISKIDGFQKTIIDGIKYLESVINTENEGEEEQNNRLVDLESLTAELQTSLTELRDYLKNTIEVNVNDLSSSLTLITEKVNNITNLIQVSTKEGNALQLLSKEDVEDGQIPGLYVPDLSETLTNAANNITTIQETVENIQESLDTFVTKEELGGDGFEFVDQSDYNAFVDSTNTTLSNIRKDLNRTVKTGEDGHVDTLYVNQLSKDNDDGNIKITDSFEVESGIPLDVRFVVENLEELCNLSYKVCYSGMGVIVNSLSSLYILRKPTEGNKITQEYISNIYNWKCPEDLVTVALTRDEYDNLEEVNPNVFYYVYEEEIKLTKEPKPEEFGSEEEYAKAFQDWVDSLKILSQEYMSASWGVDIENKLSKKANQTSVNALSLGINDLQEQINLLSGGDSDTSLSNLAGRLSSAESDLEFLLGTDGNDEEPSTQGKISEIETSISTLDSKVTNEYVSVESITNESDTDNYIFIKKSEYASDVANRDEALAKEVNTESMKASKVETNSISVSNITMTSNGSDLLVNDKEVALLDSVPKMVYLTQSDYDAMSPEEIDPDTYYYTTNEEIYITKTEFDAKVTQLNTSIVNLQQQITDLSDIVTKLEARLVVLEQSEDLESGN